MNQEELIAGLNDGSIKVTHCVICKGPHDNLTLVIPEEQTAKRIGERKGHMRIALLGLCDDCVETHGEAGVAQRINEELLRQFQVQ